MSVKTKREPLCVLFSKVTLGLCLAVSAISVAAVLYFSLASNDAVRVNPKTKSIKTTEFSQDEKPLAAKSSQSDQDVFFCGASTVTDVDKNVYATVQIGSQCWMKENLKVTKNPEGKEISRDCYGDDPKVCETEGGLYDWYTAMDNSLTEGAQGICPRGWHIPKDSEWHELENNFKSPDQPCPAEREGLSCEFAGAELKVGGSSGFDGLLPGYHYRDDLFYERSWRGDYWSSNYKMVYSSIYPWSRQLGSGLTAVGRYTQIPIYALSVRCLKD